MKAVGIVVEYNPFHNGHAYHLEKSKQITDCDVAIAAMSGSFLQRGEPALVSKWSRTEMALRAGVDIVIELPYPFAVQKAETFARGSIGLLEAMKCSNFSFGSENGEIEPFIRTHTFLENNKEAFGAALQLHMKAGNSYPKAASLAYSDLNPNRDALDLSKPNNILGLEYVKTAMSHSYSIVPSTFERIQAGYHDPIITANPIASATGIRKALMEGSQDISQIEKQVPESTKAELLSYLTEHQSFHNWEKYWLLLKYRIVTTSLQQLEQIYEVEEGIEYRLKKAAETSGSFAEFMAAVKTKRYTWTRIQRICVHILMNALKDDMFLLQKKPAYIRLLGLSHKGREYLQAVKKDLPLPLVSKLSAYKGREIEADVLAARVHSLALSSQSQDTLIKREYQPPVLH